MKNLTALHLGALAVAAVDGLESVGANLISQSADFASGTVLDSKGRKWTVKVPLTAQAATTLEAEVSLAPQMLEQLRAGNLNFDVIRPAGFAKSGFGRALVFPRPIGKMRDFAALDSDGAHEMGRTLATLHSLPHSTIDNAGLPVYTPSAWRRRLLTELHDIEAAATIPPILRRRWENAFESEALWEFEPVVVHGDVAPENFLWSEGSVTCVLGMGEAHVGDPAVDFAMLLSDVDEDHFDAVLESYSNSRDVDDNFFNRAMLMSEFALARWLMFGVRTGDNEIKLEAGDMLIALAEEVENDPELAVGPTWKVDPEPVAESDVLDVLSSPEDADELPATGAPAWLTEK